MGLCSPGQASRLSRTHPAVNALFLEVGAGCEEIAYITIGQEPWRASSAASLFCLSLPPLQTLLHSPPLISNIRFKMRYALSLIAALAITNVYAASFAELGATLSSYTKLARDAIPAFPVLEERKDPECPAVWKNVVKDLTAMFLDKSVSPSQCNDDARAAIRVCAILIPFLILD